MLIPIITVFTDVVRLLTFQPGTNKNIPRLSPSEDSDGVRRGIPAKHSDTLAACISKPRFRRPGDASPPGTVFPRAGERPTRECRI